MKQLNYSELKSLAREQLDGKILMLFLCTLIVGLITGAASFIPFGSLVITPVLSYGVFVNYMAINGGDEPKVERLFDGFKDFGKVWVTFFLMGLYTVLWSLLLWVPGVIKGIAYSFSPYILHDRPELSPSEIITESVRLTDGHKWELFVLGLSFIGWIFVGMLTLGIGYIWIIPYMQATHVNAYRELSAPDNNCVYDSFDTDF